MDQPTVRGFGEESDTIGSSLDDLFGVWSQEEAESFDNALELFETVDAEVWE